MSYPALGMSINTQAHERQSTLLTETGVSDTQPKAESLQDTQAELF